VLINLASQTESLKIIGSNYNDTLLGGLGNDTITGGVGNDSLTGGAGDDSIVAGAGNDTIVGFLGKDTVDGGAATESNTLTLTATSTDLNTALDAQLVNVQTVSATGATKGVAINLRNQFEAFNILGSSYNDTLTGGHAGDTITGGTGNDIIYGREGSDTLNGNGGFDYFVFDTAPGPANVDRIIGFSVSDDLIFLNSSLAFTGMTAGSLSTGAFVAGGTPTASGSSAQVLFNTSTGSLSFDDDGGGSHAAVQFAILSGWTGTLAAKSFYVL
jgi:Ca2+-binding RTX toxin-like protein